MLEKIEKNYQIDFLSALSYNSGKMKPKINIEHICNLAHLRLTEEEKSLRAPQLIKIEDPIAMYLSDKFTVMAHLSGIPAISIPVGLSRKKLPIGLQILGNFFQESLLFKLAFLLEKK